MKIGVCVKQVPATSETRLDPVTHTIIRESGRNILNPFDAFAVEEGIRLKERFGGQVTVLSMGIPQAQETLRRTIATGADEAVLLTDRAFAGSDTLSTACTLSEGIRKLGGFDLIVCGHMATDGDTAQVGPMLAEYLGIPHVTGVSAVESVRQGMITLRKLTDDGYLRLQVPMPALITVLKEINIPRLPSLAGVLRGERARIRQLDAAMLGIPPEKTGLKGSPTRVIGTSRPQIRTERVRIEGSPGEQAGKVVSLLKEWGLLRKGADAEKTNAVPDGQDIGIPGKGLVLPDNLIPEKMEPAQGSIWVYCEQGPGGLREVSGELLGKARELALELKCRVSAVVPVSFRSFDAGKAIWLAGCGADEILLMEENPEPAGDEKDIKILAEAPEDEMGQTDRICELADRYHPQVLLIGATAYGRSLAPRIAARLRTGLTADCTGLGIDPGTKLLVQTRPAFGGSLMARIICPQRRPQMSTVRPKVFPATYQEPAKLPAVFRFATDRKSSPFTILEFLPSREGENISEAKLLVSVGQGAGGDEQIAMARQLAGRLGGALCGSRPMVDSGKLPYVLQVGQTGKTVSPALYLSLGISGAVQHMAGVAAQKIIAVNTDPDAPIFQYAHYIVQCDSGAFLRGMLEMI